MEVVELVDLVPLWKVGFVEFDESVISKRYYSAKMTLCYGVTVMLLVGV